MDHFTLGDWADFARQITPPALSVEMQQHLDNGCLECSKVVRMWRDLIDFRFSERALRI